MRHLMCHSFFFFQAEDGIRDSSVTGVQTCALPICDQADGEKTGGRDHPQDGSRSPGASGEAASQIAWWHSPQHSFYRAFEWNFPRTTGQFDAQISSRGPSPQSLGDGHVSDWMLLQFLFSTS